MTDALTVKQAHYYLNGFVHIRTIHKMIVRKNTPFPNAFRQGRDWFIPVSDLETFKLKRIAT